MAGRTALLQRKPAASGPIDLNKARRRQIIGANHGAGRNFLKGECSAIQGSENTIAQIDEIGGARSQILIWRGAVLRNLCLLYTSDAADE